MNTVSCKCGGDSKVIDSRVRKPAIGVTTIRQRQCRRCNSTWKTIEVDIEDFKASVSAKMHDSLLTTLSKMFSNTPLTK